MHLLKNHSLFIFVIFTSILLALLGENTALSLRYERGAIDEGEIWRLFSANFLHSGWNHLWLNLTAFIVIYSLFFKYLSNSAWWFTTIFSSLGITLSIYIFMSELGWYVGLSGVLHSLVVVGSIAGFYQGRKEFILLLIIVCLKIIFEQFFTPISSTLISIDTKIIVNAHLYGVIIGFISVLILQIYNEKNR